MNEQMIRKNNMKIYPIYKMFSWDLLFYFAIIFLFLTQTKGFSASQVLLADSFYAFFRVISQIFCVKIVDLLGKQKSLLLGNLLVAISILLLILGNKFSFLIFLYFIEAIGFNLKSICGPTILSDSIPESSSSSKIYAKIDGKGSSFYYMFNAISFVIAGFLYVVNPYIPIILCFVCCLISTIISLGFNEPINKPKEKSVGFIEYYKDLLEVSKKIMKSKRLKSLLIIALIFWGVLSVSTTIRSSILVDIGVSEQYFGIIIGAMQVISSICAMKQDFFHKTFKNRLLSWFSLSVSVSFIITGLLVICNINFMVSLLSVLSTIFILGIVKGPYPTLIQKYLDSFSNSDVNTKIFALKSLVENLGRILLSFLAAILLDITTTSYTFVIMGCILFIIFIFLLDYMKNKVGLKPEEYPEEDLIFSNENK